VGISSVKEGAMAHDYREVANEIDRLIRVGYGGQDLLTRLATKYPHLTQAEFNEAFEETKAIVQRRVDAVEQKIAGRGGTAPKH
jgi:hypothetical protein